MNVKLDVRKLLGFRLEAVSSVEAASARAGREETGLKPVCVGIKQGAKVGRKTSPRLGLKKGSKRGIPA